MTSVLYLGKSVFGTLVSEAVASGELRFLSPE